MSASDVSSARHVQHKTYERFDPVGLACHAAQGARGTPEKRRRLRAVAGEGARETQPREGPDAQAWPLDPLGDLDRLVGATQESIACRHGLPHFVQLDGLRAMLGFG